MSDNWKAEYEAKRSAEQKEAEKQIRKVCEVLEGLGVKTVTVHYDGEGDDGSIEDVDFEPEPAAGIPNGIDDVIRDAAYDFLPDGWENNEGSFGTLEIDVGERKVHRDHSWRVVETESDQAEFEL